MTTHLLRLTIRGSVVGLALAGAAAEAQRRPSVPREAVKEEVVIGGPRSTGGINRPAECSSRSPGQNGGQARCLNPQPLPPRHPVPTPDGPQT